MIVKKKLKKVNTEKKSQILKADRQTRRKRKKYLKKLIYVADNWGVHGWNRDVSIGHGLNRKPRTIRGYRAILGIKRDGSRDQSKIDEVREEYNQLVTKDEKEKSGRHKARVDGCKEITARIKKLKEDEENFQEDLVKYILEERHSIRDKIADLEEERYKAEIRAVRKYNKKIRAERLEKLGYKWSKD